MTAKLTSALFAFLQMTSPVAAQPAPKAADEKALVTKVYNIKPLLGERGRANNISDADAIIKLIVETLPFDNLKPGTDGPQLIERDGGKLEVRATAKVHDEIKDLLEALERLIDVAVDVKADVIELDIATFEKLQKELPTAGKGKPGSPILFATGEEHEKPLPPAEEKALAETNKILKAGRVVQSSSGRFVNGIEASFAARQAVLTFHPGFVNDKPTGTPQIVKEGFKLLGFPVVSADRRFVRLKLTEQSVVVTRIKRVEAGEVVANQNLVIQSAETEDLGAVGSAVVDDGGTLVFRLAYAPKDKVWLVVLKPRIFIQAEEDELKKQEKK